MADVSTETVIQLRSAPLRRLTGVKVLGTGSFVPDNIVRNEDLAALGYDADWIVQRTGIQARRHCPPEMCTSDLAVEAARQAIEAAGIDPEQIDLVLLGTFTADLPVPATACIVQERLGLNCAAMDVQAACAGFMYALVTGMQYVASGCSHAALVIGADTTSRIVDPADRKTYPLFGDGAGAVVLGPGTADQGLLSYCLGADGSGLQLLCTAMGGSRRPTTIEGAAEGLQFMRMDGRPVFKWAVRMLAQSSQDVLQHAGLTTDQVDLVVLHQANIRIIDAAIADLGIPREKVFVNIERYGNTSAGSVPLVLDEAFKAGRIRAGSNILMSGFGAGLAWGTSLLRW